MQIMEVMRRVHSEGEVRFLLSAYVETLPFYDHSRSLPRHVTTLPLSGVDDVRARFESLLDIELNDGAACAAEGEREGVHAIVREATEIFGVALTRLQSLQAGVAAVPAKTDLLVF